MKTQMTTMENTDTDGEITQSENCLTTPDSSPTDHTWTRAIGVPLTKVLGPQKKRTSWDRRKSKFGCGRTALTIEERGIQITVRVTPETYQRIQWLSKKLECTYSKAVERLIRTEESERIEKTLPIDKLSLIDTRKKYSITNILDGY